MIDCALSLFDKQAAITRDELRAKLNEDAEMLGTNFMRVAYDEAIAILDGTAKPSGARPTST